MKPIEAVDHKQILKAIGGTGRENDTLRKDLSSPILDPVILVNQFQSIDWLSKDHQQVVF